MTLDTAGLLMIFVLLMTESSWILSLSTPCLICWLGWVSVLLDYFLKHMLTGGFIKLFVLMMMETSPLIVHVLSSFTDCGFRHVCYLARRMVRQRLSVMQWLCRKNSFSMATPNHISMILLVRLTVAILRHCDRFGGACWNSPLNTDGSLSRLKRNGAFLALKPLALNSPHRVLVWVKRWLMLYPIWCSLEISPSCGGCWAWLTNSVSVLLVTSCSCVH